MAADRVCPGTGPVTQLRTHRVVNTETHVLCWQFDDAICFREKAPAGAAIPWVWCCLCGRHIAPLPNHGEMAAGVVASVEKQMKCLLGGWLQ